MNSKKQSKIVTKTPPTSNKSAIVVDDHYWLDCAILEATKAQNLGEVPVGAVLVDDEQQLIARAFNTPIKHHNASAHAEIEVIKAAGHIRKNYRLPNTTLYVTLEPCVMCAGAIIQARIKRVVFAAYDLRAGACGSVFDLSNHPSLNHRFDIDFIERPDYIEQFKHFFRSRR